MKNSLYTIFFVSIYFLSGCSKTDNSSEDIAQEISEGEKLVKNNCKVCHAQGINGAPIIGNKKMWGARVGKGKDELISNAINGFGLMPAKGGSGLTDEEIAVAVEFMLKQVSE